ncbi:MAG: hypothetical protein U1E05_17725, partial [Patescibacteria group bacterium]|nr:hypothetical protein [Patescibacteria group bacterium]
MSRLVARSKTFLTQACGASILAFGHAYGAYSAFGNRLETYLKKVELDGVSLEAAAEMLVRENAADESLGVSYLMLRDPAAQRVFARAEKLGVAGKYVEFTRLIVAAAKQRSETPVDLDMLGAIGATMLDLGFSPEATWAIMAVTRAYAAGAHYIEEVEREGMTRLGEELTPPDWYDGPAERPVPPLNERPQACEAAVCQSPEAWKQRFDRMK